MDFGHGRFGGDAAGFVGVLSGSPPVGVLRCAVGGA
jgi:hypothetical protein